MAVPVATSPQNLVKKKKKKSLPHLNKLDRP